MAETQRRCTEKGCMVATTGECINGLAIGDCTHLQIISLTTGDDNNDSSESFVDAKIEKLKLPVFSGDALTLEECNSIASNSLTRLIILAGRAESGKTTLISSLFQLFQNSDSFSGYKFAGSKTLIGLEKRCHKSRISSGLSNPETPRTIPGAEQQVLHLKLSLHDNLDLLFTDISGEKFKDLSDSSEECKKFTLAKRADHFVLFLDADLLSEPSTKNKTKVEGIGILRSLLEAGMLSNRTQIQVVFSKWDLLKQKNRQENIAFVEQIKKEINSKFKRDNWQIQYFEVATRPIKDSEFSFGHGLNKLLPIWFKKSQFVNGESFSYCSSAQKNAPHNRQFYKYKMF